MEMYGSTLKDFFMLHFLVLVNLETYESNKRDQICTPQVIHDFWFNAAMNLVLYILVPSQDLAFDSFHRQFPSHSYAQL
mgnify:CR=1 FL=1